MNGQLLNEKLFALQELNITAHSYRLREVNCSNGAGHFKTMNAVS